MHHAAARSRTSTSDTMMSQPGDSALVAAAARGSIEALGELYRKHSALVFTTAYRLTASRHDAEDILQDVFVGLPRALRGYREQGRFEQWLGRVTTRTALMHLRAHRRKREDDLDAVAETHIPAASSDPIDPLVLESLLLRLPEQLRVVFILKEIEGYTHAEIGGLLGISANNSAVRLNRAWLQLRNEART
jgi:RNA polymerase sigma-70 factor (ECF subfamily)